MGHPVTATQPMPPWLRRILAQQGWMDETGATRTARPRRCPACQRTVLAGLDSRLAAFTTRVDPHPVNTHGEAHGLLAGRRSYELWNADSPRPELSPRWPERITAAPAGSSRAHPVLLTHLCHDPLPDTWLAPITTPPTPPHLEEVLF
jgi:hypothetical protein